MQKGYYRYFVVPEDEHNLQVFLQLFFAHFGLLWQTPFDFLLLHNVVDLTSVHLLFSVENNNIDTFSIVHFEYTLNI